jgi:uncharacterized protein (DUF1697 family)
MEQRVALLRGINLGPKRRIAMADLREMLTGAGFEKVRTYVQSGNIVLASDSPPENLEERLEQLIAERFGFEVGVIVRTRDELAEVVDRDPFADEAVDPKRYQVSFLEEPLEPSTVEELAEFASESERFCAIGRELYAWHPAGVARSRLWAKLAGAGLGVKATARNWTTVTTLLAMADE